MRIGTRRRVIMIFAFPSLESVHLALTSGLVTLDVGLKPVEAAFDEAGSITVRPLVEPPKALAKALKRLGVSSVSAHQGDSQKFNTWVELLALERDPNPPEVDGSTVVIFELPQARLASLTVEMLRLGNDRQSYRVIDSAGGPRVLLRVIGPPYYSLLRALDHLDADLTAYVERSPRVWIEMGLTHPLTAKLQAPPERLLLIRSPRQWTMLDDTPFIDVHELIDYQLPSPPVRREADPARQRLSVPLRLVAGDAADLPEMWVLHDNALAVLDEFVREADERILDRLMFAATADGATIIVRARQPRLAPPALELTGSRGYCRYRQLNNLFLPAGTRLQPLLRRESVRRLLAEDDDRTVWLTPGESGRFAPESIPESAFRPLPDWVEYVIDHERQALFGWVQANQFEFDSFICAGSLPDEPARPSTGKPKPKPEAPPPKKLPPAKEMPNKEEAAYQPVIEPPNVLQQQREELELAYLACEGPLESAERAAFWPRLAQLNAHIADRTEAAVCWAHAFWTRDDLPPDWLETWRESEQAGEIRAADFDHDLAIEMPATADLRRLVCRVLSACALKPAPAFFLSRLPKIRQYLEAYEVGLGVRTAWLVSLHLARISGDALALARARDRLLLRLFERGPRPIDDVPAFIHHAGRGDNGRFRRLQEQMIRSHGEVRAWLKRQDATTNTLHFPLSETGWYADLIFTYGLAKLGEERQRTELKSHALTQIRNRPKADPAALFLADAFEHRITQAAMGREIETLPSAILGRLEGLERPTLYNINRLRKELQILEPREKSDPYLPWKTAGIGQLAADLANLPRLTDPQRLQREIRRLLANQGRTLDPLEKSTLLIEAIPLAPRAGTGFVHELLGHVLPALSLFRFSPKNPSPTKDELDRHARLVAAAVPIAAHFDAVDLLRLILAKFLENLRVLDEPARINSLNLAITTWRSPLFRCGLSGDLQTALAEIRSLVLKDRSLDALRTEYRHETKRDRWIDLLRCLLHLAEWDIAFGDLDLALPMLDEARTFLLDRTGASSTPLRSVPLISAYLRAVGQAADLDFVATRSHELLAGMEMIPNSLTTKEIYSSLHLTIVENLVLALVNDEFIQGAVARRWLDEDEYLVRRRIHDDLKRAMVQG